MPDESKKNLFDDDKTVLNGSTTLLNTALSDAHSQVDFNSLENSSIQKGDVLLDTYQVESDAIHGGMGSVWRVHHRTWNIDLAMKRPQAHCFSTQKSKETFICECEAWVNLGLHPNIVSCYYVREINETPAIFSEWMDGGSLHDAIKSGSLYAGTTIEQHARILDIAIQFARGLHYAHEAGLIHQDVKPDNLLLTKDEQAKVADFGLAKARTVLTGNASTQVDENSEKRIVSAAGSFTPAYCSMEQMDGKELTHKTDIYSWAVSVMEMYLGSRPWVNGVVAGLECRKYFDQSQISIPDALKYLLKQCLSDVPANRPHDFAEIEATLQVIYKATTNTSYARSSPKAAFDTADSLNNRALSMLDLGKSAQAKQYWKQALTVEPDHPESLFNSTILQWRNGEITNTEANISLKRLQTRLQSERYTKLFEDFSSEQGCWMQLADSEFASQAEAENHILKNRIYQNATICRTPSYSSDKPNRNAIQTGRLVKIDRSPFHIAANSLATEGFSLALYEATSGRIRSSIDYNPDVGYAAFFDLVAAYAVVIEENTYRIAAILTHGGFNEHTGVIRGYYVGEFELKLGKTAEFKLSYTRSFNEYQQINAALNACLDQAATLLQQGKNQQAFQKLADIKHFPGYAQRNKYRTLIVKLTSICERGAPQTLTRLRDLEGICGKEIWFADEQLLVCFDSRKGKLIRYHVCSTVSSILDLKDCANRGFGNADFSAHAQRLLAVTQSSGKMYISLWNTETGNTLCSGELDCDACLGGTALRNDGICAIMGGETRPDKNDFAHGELLNLDFQNANGNYETIPASDYRDYFFVQYMPDMQHVIYELSYPGQTSDIQILNLRNKRTHSLSMEFGRSIQLRVPSAMKLSSSGRFLYIAGGENSVREHIGKNQLYRYVISRKVYMRSYVESRLLPDQITCLCISPDESMVVVGTIIGRILVFSADLKEILFETGIEDKVLSLAFSKDSSYLTAGMEGNTALFYLEYMWNQPADASKAKKMKFYLAANHAFCSIFTTLHQFLNEY